MSRTPSCGGGGGGGGEAGAEERGLMAWDGVAQRLSGSWEGSGDGPAGRGDCPSDYISTAATAPAASSRGSAREIPPPLTKGVTAARFYPGPRFILYASERY